MTIDNVHILSTHTATITACPSSIPNYRIRKQAAPFTTTATIVIGTAIYPASAPITAAPDTIAAVGSNNDRLSTVRTPTTRTTTPYASKTLVAGTILGPFVSGLASVTACVPGFPSGLR
ncbi:uncharacterized protein BO97DRAFT_424554 [Aspergillus homomorphus CBS 101889]|uniref:Uncharacterized protein n=1 Tax=Aspergillus homomorphus (strain CBS 101889) TaxID=1450537 RepID=A0A395HXD7_ASPHC|nr:hypothetical protein BO97DRAFT_424554 [Aspergillus homomorphus CBS 101889]RAL12467.1 hypothetical protein BO97DRAFT_424554 [Aspergillus homomorphus CBS 101889]